jgi:hypothetical protein
MQTRPLPAEPPQNPPEASDPLDTRLRRFDTLLAAAFAGVILVNCALILVFWYQTRLVRAQYAQKQQILSRYHLLEAPAVQEVLSKLETFSLQNRDYAALLRRYQVLYPHALPGNTPPKTTSPLTLPPGK